MFKRYNQQIQPSVMTYFVFFLILNFLSNIYGMKYLSGSHFSENFFTIVSIFALSGLCSCVESLILGICRNYRLLKSFLLVSFILIHYVCISVETFLYFLFDIIVGQDVIDILAETNSKEVSEFLRTYFNFESFIYIVIAPSLILLIAIWVKRRVFCSRFVFNLMILLATLGSLIVLKGTYAFVRYHSGEGLPQLTTITRGGYAYYVMRKQSAQFPAIIDKCVNVDVVMRTEFKPFKRVIVIIGESNSYYHCSLYGYEKETFPYMESLKAEGSLIAFEDVVTPYDATHGVMMQLFSLDGDDFGNAPLFPAFFKKAGYKTQMLDNQYFVNKGVNFLTDEALSNTLFDSRNTEHCGYDGNLIPMIERTDCPSLLIIHLNGQHYTYKDRFPKEFEFYSAADYSKKTLSLEQKEVVAAYDNAGRYCDFVLNNVIERFMKEDAIMIFLSDHGEEVYDVRDYMGHGSALSSPDPTYLLRVPFFVWMSDSARINRKEIYDNLRASVQVPFVTSSFSHFVLDICGFQSEVIRTDKNFVSSDYNKLRPRIVLNSINFDETYR